MLIRNVELSDLEQALTSVNAIFSGNVKFRRCDRESGSRGGGQTFWKVTLTCKDSRAPGSRHNLSGRRIAGACWHAHGMFHDSLPPDSTIKSAFSGKTASPGDAWIDWPVQYMGHRGWFSDTCDCDTGPPFIPFPLGGVA